MADNQNDIERLTLAALGLSTPEEVRRFQDELSRDSNLAAQRAKNARDAEREQLRLASYPAHKRILDLTLGLLLLMIFSPLILIFAILIRLTDWGPAIVSVPAMGRGARYFRLYRLRCLYLADQRARDSQGAALEENPKGDNWRVTPVGRFLNRLRIGRLPSIWNVVRGEMSLVGPRPQFHVLAHRVMRDYPEHTDRTQLSPGIIGLWYILLKRPITVDLFPELLAVDLYYTRHASLSLDIRVLIAAGLLAFRLPRAVVIPTCGLPSLASIMRTERVEEPEIIEAYTRFVELYHLAGLTFA